MLKIDQLNQYYGESHILWDLDLTVAEPTSAPFAGSRRARYTPPRIEAFYQRMMICYKASGRTAEALATYHHCSDILQNHLQISPCAETLALYEALRN